MFLENEGDFKVKINSTGGLPAWIFNVFHVFFLTKCQNDMTYELNYYNYLPLIGEFGYESPSLWRAL